MDNTIVNTPPYDEVVENAILSGLIMYPDEFNKVDSYSLNGEVFYQTRAKLLWKLLQRMKYNKEDISMPTVCASLTAEDIRRGLDRFYVVDITSDAPSNIMLEAYAQKAYEKYLLREVINATHKIQQKAYDNNIDAYNEIITAHNIILLFVYY